MPQPETLLVGRIRKAILVEFPSAFVTKIAGGAFQNAGLPDLLVIVDGRAVGLEVKCPGPTESDDHARARETLRQRSVREAIGRAGGVAEVILTPEEALAAIRRAI
jgi:hypothetical protein